MTVNVDKFLHKAVEIQYMEPLAKSYFQKHYSKPEWVQKWPDDDFH